MSDYPRTRQGLEKAHFAKLGKAVCRDCDAPIEWWKTPTGKKIPITVTIRGQIETLTMHQESCPARRDFTGAGSGPDARKPEKYSNEASIRNMRQRTNARAVILITDQGCEATWRDGIPAEDLRSEIIAAANQVRNSIYAEEAKSS